MAAKLVPEMTRLLNLANAILTLGIVLLLAHGLQVAAKVTPLPGPPVPTLEHFPR